MLRRADGLSLLELGNKSLSHIFISYCQSEGDFAFRLMTELEKQGWDTWIDKHRLRGGADWSDEIDAGIREALAMVVVMSPDAKSSEYVTYEWSCAVGAGVPLIPILLKKTELHPRLARYQYLDFTNPNIRPWDDLKRDIGDVRASAKRSYRLPRACPEYVRRAIDALDSASPQDRYGGISVLSEVAEREPIAESALVEALDHALPGVRVGASNGLISSGLFQHLDKIMEVVVERASITSDHASDSKGELPEIDLAPIAQAKPRTILEALRHPNTQVRRTIQHWCSGSVPNLPFDVGMAFIEDPELTDFGLEVISMHGGKEITITVARLINSGYISRKLLDISIRIESYFLLDNFVPVMKTLRRCYEFDRDPCHLKGFGDVLNTCLVLSNSENSYEDIILFLRDNYLCEKEDIHRTGPNERFRMACRGFNFPVLSLGLEKFENYSNKEKSLFVARHLNQENHYGLRVENDYWKRMSKELKLENNYMPEYEKGEG